MVRAVRFLMGEKDQGIVPGGFYFGRIDRSRMYGQGIITFGLASAVVDLEDKDLRSLCIERLIDAKDLILRAQDTTKQPGHDGGWRYEPQSKDSDLSITAWQLLALKTMVDQLGVTVPSTTWSRACSYVIGTGSAVPGKAEFTFGYDGKGGQIRFSGNASALVSLQCCGAGNTDEARGGISFMDTHFPAADERWFYYGIAHATRAFRSAGDADLLGRYAQRLKDVLLPRQQADGSWKSEEGHEKPLGSLFSTAMAVSALAPMLTHIQETRETR